MWTFHNPVRIHFGSGAFAALPGLIGQRRYALVTYPEPVFKETAAWLARAAHAPVLTVDDVKPNPDRADLARQAPRLAAAQQKPELIVAIGGGSVIDSAKVLAASNGDFAPVWDVLTGKRPAASLSPLPIIAVPTTAGTGSEVTSWATVWDGDAGKKYSLAASSLYPAHAVLDPDLSVSCPKGLTVATGLDALSHALESVWNRNANPVSSGYAVAAVREILDTLPKLATRLDDKALRERMLKASMLAGLAFSNTKTAIAHSMSYPVTLHYGITHGIACSFTLPMVLRSVIGLDAACDATLRQIFGDDLADGADRLAAFLGSLGVATSADRHGVPRDAWHSIIEEAMGGERGLNFLGTRERLLAAA